MKRCQELGSAPQCLTAEGLMVHRLVETEIDDEHHEEMLVGALHGYGS